MTDSCLDHAASASHFYAEQDERSGPKRGLQLAWQVLCYAPTSVFPHETLDAKLMRDCIKLAVLWPE